MRRFCSLAVFVLICGCCCLAQGLSLWDISNIDDIKNNPARAIDRGKILEQAQAFLQAPLVIVTDKKWSFADDMHYYTSMAPYWWPVEKDGKVIYENRDGLVNPQSNELDKKKISILSERLKYFSLAYYFTEDEQYYEAFIQQIDAWFINKKTYMYPNFLYSQIVPGRGGNFGRPIGILEGYPFITAMESIRLMQSARSIGRWRTRKLVRWFREMGDWIETSDLGKKDALSNSNSGIAYDALLTDISLFVGNNERAQRIIQAFPENRIYKQIEEDGKQPAELARTKAFEYSVYNLEFFITFCSISNAAGIDTYNSNKERINAAFLYLLQFIGNTDNFPYSQITDWRQQEVRLYRLIAETRKLNPKIEIELRTSDMLMEKNTKGWILF